MCWKPRRGVLTACFLTVATALGFAFQSLNFPEANIVLCYLFAVVMTAWLTPGYLYGVACCVAGTLLFNWFFTAPVYTLAVNDPSYWVTFLIMTVIAVITSTLTSRAKQNAQDAHEREEETKTLYHLTQQMASAKNRDEAARIAAKSMEESAGVPASFLPAGDKGLPKKSAALEFPVEGANGTLGVLKLDAGQMDGLDGTHMQLMQSIADTLALALERITALELHFRSSEEAERERYRGNLLRAISHDLRTPLAGIMGAAEMLEHQLEDRPDCWEMAAGIYRDADWLHSLVENILNLTRLQAGALALNRDMEAVEEVVGSAICRIAKRAGGREIAVDAPEEFLVIPMDARLIEQVIVNLLDNAIKHTCENEEISIKVEDLPEAVRICVLDRGCGIAPEDLPNIFQMFYTSRARRPDASPGMGLGLAICEAIVQAHGGSIAASNREDGPGAQFCFTLPKDAPQARQEGSL